MARSQSPTTLANSGPQGARGRTQAPRHVHRLDVVARPAPPRLRGRRQLHRRSARRLRRHDRRHDPRRRLGHRQRQRPRHSGRHAPDGEDPGRRGRDDRAARRRQVRQGQLQGVRRTARRRRVRRERAVREAQGVGQARRQRALHGLRARRHDDQAEGARQVGAKERGTKVWFKPDDQIFTELQYDYATLATACASCRSSTRASRSR